MIINRKKILRTIGFICIITLIVTIIYGLFISSLFNIISIKKVDKNELIQTFNQNKRNFETIASYLQDTKEDVEIRKEKWGKYSITKTTNDGNNKYEINNKKLNGKIENILFKFKFEYIIEDLNGIYFIRSTSFGFQQAIVYSKDGEEPHPYRPKILECIKNRWYYCESED